MKLKRVQHHLSEDQIKKLDKISDKTGLSRSDLIRCAIDAYIKKEKEKT